MPGRPRKKRIRAIGEGGSSTRVSKAEDVDVVIRGPLRDEDVSGSRGGPSGSRGRGGAGGSRCSSEEGKAFGKKLNVEERIRYK
ncbi:hypothetical protein Tco_0985390 [Tanacetum coccineum]